MHKISSETLKGDKRLERLAVFSAFLAPHAVKGSVVETGKIQMARRIDVAHKFVVIIFADGVIVHISSVHCTRCIATYQYPRAG
jgi:hypothetical protein